MKIATAPEAQRQWMAQWRLAEVALAQIKAEELQALAEETALRDSDMLLRLAPDAIQRACARFDSGSIEQQRLFARARA